MELAVGAFVAILVASFAAGLVAGALTWRRAAVPEPQPRSATSSAASAGNAAEVGQLRHDLAKARDELANLRSAASWAGARPGTEVPSTAPISADEPATRAPVGETNADLRRRFAHIIGLESEIASLRAVAERVPALERRIRELEAAAATGAPVMDLTNRQPDLR